MFERTHYYSKPVMTQHMVDVAQSHVMILIQALAHDLTHYADRLCEEHDMQYFFWA